MIVLVFSRISSVAFWNVSLFASMYAAKPCKELNPLNCSPLCKSAPEYEQYRTKSWQSLRPHDRDISSYSHSKHNSSRSLCFLYVPLPAHVQEREKCFRSSMSTPELKKHFHSCFTCFIWILGKKFQLWLSPTKTKETSCLDSTALVSINIRRCFGRSASS